MESDLVKNYEAATKDKSAGKGRKSVVYLLLVLLTPVVMVVVFVVLASLSAAPMVSMVHMVSHRGRPVAAVLSGA